MNKDYMEHMYTEGGYYPPSQHNLQTYYNMYEGIVLGYSEGVVMMARDDDKYIGFVWGGNVPDSSLQLESDLGKVFFFYACWVQPEHRGRGISVELNVAAIENAADRGFKSFMTDVRNGNNAAEHSALRLYGCTSESTLYIGPIHAATEM